MARDYAIRRASEALNPWTPARQNDVRRLWYDGKSASEIAAALGGTTRSAVLGVISRNGWRRTQDGHAESTAGYQVNKRVAPARAVPARVRAPPPPEPAERVEGIGIMALTLTTCRFIVDATRHDAKYCGAWCADVDPYCARHRRMCWQGTPPAIKPPRRERLT